MERNPYFWLNTVVRLPLFGLKWLVLIAGIAWMVAAFGAVNGQDTGTRELFAIAVLAIAFGLQVWIRIFAVLVSTRSLSEDRAGGGLELLLSSPFPPRKIIKGQELALYWRFRLPLAVGVVMSLGFVLLPLMAEGGIMPGVWNWILFSLVSAITLITDIQLISIVGMQQALRASNPYQAFRATMVRTVVPSTVLLISLTILATLQFSILAILIGVIAWIGMQVMLANRARIDLSHGFRTLAAGLPFDTGDWVVRETFQRALQTDIRQFR